MRTRSGLILLLAILVVSPAVAQNCAISLDGIIGVVRNDSANAGNTLGFQIRYRNLSDSGFNISNGWKIYSPEGASWTDSAYGNFHGANLGPIGIDTTGLLSKAQFPIVFALRTFSSAGTIARADGLSPDTVTFSGAGGEIGQGLPPQFNNRVLTIYIKTRLADTNKTICIDSVSRFPPTNLWKWAVLYGGPMPDSVNPVWSGAHCVRIVSRVWDPIYLPICPSTISASHCQTITYHVQAYIPGADSTAIRYLLASGPGTIDPVTGVWTATSLPTGSYPLTVGATNIYNNDSIFCTMTIIATNVAPQFSAVTYSANAVVGQLCTFTPTVTGDCDANTFALIDTDGAEGPSSINTATGQLSFTPTAVDSARTEPIGMRITVVDGQGGVDTATVVWKFVNACIGTVGNIDCDPLESVDIGDMTRLIDYLFMTFSPLCSPGEANVDGDALGKVNLADLSYLISYLFVQFLPLQPCR